MQCGYAEKLSAHTARAMLVITQGRETLNSNLKGIDMSVSTTNHVSPFAGFFEGLREFGAKLGQAMIVNRSLDARMAQIEKLQSKSDAELKELGLRRDQIATFVFRDLFYA
jgi:uncharacterized protein YjiS (DUF1127 family)